MSSIGWARLAGLCWLGSLLVGCGPKKAEPAIALDTQPFVVDAPFLEAVERFRAIQVPLRSLSGRAKGTALENGKRRSFKQGFALELPGSLRVEIQTSLGQTVALFASDGQTLYFRPREGETLHGLASVASVEQALGYPLEVEELVQTLAGQVEDVPLEIGQVLRRSGDVVLLEPANPSRRTQYGFDRRGGVLRSRTFRGPGGRPELHVHYAAYTSSEGQVLPARVELQRVSNGDRIELALTSLQVNPSLSPEIFLPQGAAPDAIDLSRALGYRLRDSGLPYVPLDLP